MLYFAYGSNLDEANWGAWCRDRGYDAASIEPVGPAWLPDFELVFHYRSRLRQGGALDVRPSLGTTVAGALFRVRDWTGLDAKEGVPGGYYRRLEVTTLTADGHAHRATTYTVCDERVGSFVPPGPEYKEMVMRGLTRFGHGHDSFVAAAAGATTSPAPSMLFTYGTLMQGQCSHALLQPRIRRAHGPAQVGGASLVRIDWYPGLVLSGDGLVHGELYEIDEVDVLLQELDRYEDFAGYQHAPSLYRRSLVDASTAAGSTLAWTYVYVGDPGILPRIASGRWTDA